MNLMSTPGENGKGHEGNLVIQIVDADKHGVVGLRFFHSPKPGVLEPILQDVIVSREDSLVFPGVLRIPGWDLRRDVTLEVTRNNVKTIYHEKDE